MQLEVIYKVKIKLLSGVLGAYFDMIFYKKHIKAPNVQIYNMKR